MLASSLALVCVANTPAQHDVVTSTVASGGNGHNYKAGRPSKPLDWPGAQSDAVAEDGSLSVPGATFQGGQSLFPNNIDLLGIANAPITDEMISKILHIDHQKLPPDVLTTPVHKHSSWA